MEITSEAFCSHLSLMLLTSHHPSSFGFGAFFTTTIARNQCATQFNTDGGREMYRKYIQVFISEP